MSAPTREEFLARRKNSIGGSDIGAICGLSKFRTPVDVWLDKTGRTEEPPEPSPTGKGSALYWGTVIEEQVAQAYMLVTGKKVRRYNNLIKDSQYPFISANVDRLVCPDGGKLPVDGKNNITGELGLEIKTCRFKDDEWGTPGTDAVPDAYHAQVQWYMMLCPSVQSFDLAVLFGGNDMQIYHIKRDESIINALRAAAINFWINHVETMVPPMCTGIDDVKKLYPQSNHQTVVASDEAVQVWQELLKLSAQRKDIEKQESELKDAVATYMGENEILLGQGNTTLATFKTGARGRTLLIKPAKTANN